MGVDYVDLQTQDNTLQSGDDDDEDSDSNSNTSYSALSSSLFGRFTCRVIYLLSQCTNCTHANHI